VVNVSALPELTVAVAVSVGVLPTGRVGVEVLPGTAVAVEVAVGVLFDPGVALAAVVGVLATVAVCAGVRVGAAVDVAEGVGVEGVTPVPNVINNCGGVPPSRDENVTPSLPSGSNAKL
jgi:hypothetical protein